jgi:hypothetical protein
MADPFPGNADPFAGMPDALKPNPPASMPQPPGAGDAMAGASPFKEALDVDQIIANLTLDRPLKLFIPHKERFPQYEFRIINSIPHEIAAAHNKGFREVTEPEVTKLFCDLVAGTDKEGKAFRPMLVARPKAVGDHIRRRNRLQLASLYAGMDPSNKDLAGKYTDNVDAKNGTKGQFSGAAFRIKAGP